MKAQTFSGRERLLAATIKVVADLGLRGMTYRAVAAEAGVTNTLISYHFGTRNALLIAAMDWAVEQTSARSASSELLSHPQQFENDLLAMLEESPDIHIFQYEMLLESRRMPELREAVSGLYSRYIEAIASVLARQGYEDAKRRARLIFATLDGLVLQSLTIAAPHEIQESLKLLANMYQTKDPV